MAKILQEVRLDAAKAEALIESWFQKLVHGTVVQRDELLYNKFHAAKEDLKAQLINAPTPLISEPTTSTTTKQE